MRRCSVGENPHRRVESNLLLVSNQDVCLDPAVAALVHGPNKFVDCLVQGGGSPRAPLLRRGQDNTYREDIPTQFVSWEQQKLPMPTGMASVPAHRLRRVTDARAGGVQPDECDGSRVVTLWTLEPFGLPALSGATRMGLRHVSTPSSGSHLYATTGNKLLIYYRFLLFGLF